MGVWTDCVHGFEDRMEIFPGPLIFPVSNSNTEKSVGVKGGGRGDFPCAPYWGKSERGGVSPATRTRFHKGGEAPECPPQFPPMATYLDGRQQAHFLAPRMVLLCSGVSSSALAPLYMSTR